MISASQGSSAVTESSEASNPARINSSSEKKPRTPPPVSSLKACSSGIGDSMDAMCVLVMTVHLLSERRAHSLFVCFSRLEPMFPKVV